LGSSFGYGYSYELTTVPPYLALYAKSTEHLFTQPYRYLFGIFR